MRNPVTKHGRSLLERLIKAGIDGDIDAWSEGIPHHPKSEELVHDISEIDWMFFDDSFRLKMGGDGDNGETLMYILDILFDLDDKEAKTKHESMEGK